MQRRTLSQYKDFPWENERMQSPITLFNWDFNYFRFVALPF